MSGTTNTNPTGKLHKELDYVRRYLGRVRNYLDSDMTVFRPPTCTRINSQVTAAQNTIVSHVQQRLEEERFIRRELFMTAQRERRFLEEEDALARARRLLKLEDAVFRLNVAEVITAEKASCDLLFREAESIAQNRKVQIRRSAALEENDKLGHLAQVCREEEILKDRILREIGLSRPMMQDLCCFTECTIDDKACDRLNDQEKQSDEKVTALVYGDLKKKTVELTHRGVYRVNFRAHKIKEAKAAVLTSGKDDTTAQQIEYKKLLEEKLKALRPYETSEDQKKAVLQTISVLISGAINDARKAAGITYTQFESATLLTKDKLDNYLRRKKELLQEIKKNTEAQSNNSSGNIISDRLNTIIVNKEISDKLNALVIENETKKSALSHLLPNNYNIDSITNSILNESLSAKQAHDTSISISSNGTIIYGEKTTNKQEVSENDIQTSKNIADNSQPGFVSYNSKPLVSINMPQVAGNKDGNINSSNINSSIVKNTAYGYNLLNSSVSSNPSVDIGINNELSPRFVCDNQIETFSSLSRSPSIQMAKSINPRAYPVVESNGVNSSGVNQTIPVLTNVVMNNLNVMTSQSPNISSSPNISVVSAINPHEKFDKINNISITSSNGNSGKNSNEVISPKQDLSDFDYTTNSINNTNMEIQAHDIPINPKPIPNGVLGQFKNTTNIVSNTSQSESSFSLNAFADALAVNNPMKNDDSNINTQGLTQNVKSQSISISNSTRLMNEMMELW